MQEYQTVSEALFCVALQTLETYVTLLPICSLFKSSQTFDEAVT